MHELINLQDQFQQYLLHSDKDIQQHIMGSRKVSTETRLAIYRNAYQSRLLEALATNYPVLQKYIGDENFADLGYAYIDQYPSSYRSIRWFGDQLADFLNEYPSYEKFPYLVELAQLEWTKTLVFDAADRPVLLLDEMEGIPPEAWVNMKLQVHPSAYRLNLIWNVVQIWQKIMQVQVPAEPQQSLSAISWILWRKDLVNQFCSLTEDEAWAIDAMIKRLTFGEICEGLCNWMDEQNASIRAASLLKGWILAGLIVEIKT